MSLCLYVFIMTYFYILAHVLSTINDFLNPRGQVNVYTFIYSDPRGQVNVYSYVFSDPRGQVNVSTYISSDPRGQVNVYIPIILLTREVK